MVSGLQCHVLQRKPNVSAEHTTSVFRVEEESKQETSRSGRQAGLSSPPTFLLGLLFDPKDGGDMFLQNLRPSLNQMALQPRGLYSLQSLPREPKI
jgi:hypothetical protein